jgi:type IV secretion system protein VirD4
MVGIPPSERLQARLAELKAATPPIDPATRFIEMAEGLFRDPTNVLRAEWTRQVDASFMFSRAAHEFSDYDAFVYKLAIVAGGLGLVDRALAEEIVASATYGGGKSKVERQQGMLMSEHFPDFHKLQSKGPGNFTPKAMSELAVDISELIRSCRNFASPALQSWLDSNIGNAGAQAGGLAPSPIFATESAPFALPLGLLGSSGKTVYYTGEASLLTIAAPGKGKTQCHVLPALASYRGPVIALDIKGECYQHTADWRREHVGPVYRFNPVTPETSDSYNPLQFVDRDPDELWESSRFLVDLLVIIKSQQDSVWESQGKDLLTLIIAHVVKAKEPEARLMSEVLELLATIGLVDMLESVSAPEARDYYPGAMRRTAARFAQMAKSAPKQFEGVLSGASLHMQVWEGPKVERVTSRSDWQPEDFRTNPPPSLYLCIPPEALGTYAPLLRVIIGQHLRRLMRQHDRAHKPILFLLDELPRLGKMEPIREALEVGRSYGIKLWMIAQYPDQIVTAYPGVGSGMMESCDVRMYMNPSAATADSLVKAFGQRKSVLEGGKAPRLEASEITGPSHRDSIFVLGANEEPLVLQKRFFWAAK